LRHLLANTNETNEESSHKKVQGVVEMTALRNSQVVRSPADRLARPVMHSAGGVRADCLRARHRPELNISRSVSVKQTRISGFSNLTQTIPRSGPKSQPVPEPLLLLQ